MFDLVGKVILVVRRRPLQLLGLAVQYWRFARTRWVHRLLPFTRAGVCLGANVRVQALSCFTAERPDAAITVGEDSVIYEFARIEAYGQGKIHIGAGSIMGDVRISSRAAITIGERVITSWNVFIQDFDPHPIDPVLRGIQMVRMTSQFRPRYGMGRAAPDLAWEFPVAPIVIGNDVWIGANVTILKGARIGAGSVVATGAVVPAGDYPPRSLIAGVPAKAIKTL